VGQRLTRRFAERPGAHAARFGQNLYAIEDVAAEDPSRGSEEAPAFRWSRLGFVAAIVSSDQARRPADGRAREIGKPLGKNRDVPARASARCRKAIKPPGDRDRVTEGLEMPAAKT